MADYATLWVCVDCMMTEASGEIPEDMDERRPEPWSAIHADDQHRLITPGLMADEHQDDCPNFEDGDFVGLDDEPCEDQDFSWYPCHGCGSHLGGSRHAYTMHLD